MARLNLELPEDLRRKVEARAAESGHASVEQYVQALLHADADAVEGAGFGGPDRLAVVMADDLESLLERRLDEGGQGVEATLEFWRRLKDRARLRAGGGGRGPGQ